MNRIFPATVGLLLLAAMGCSKTAPDDATPAPTDWNYEQTNWRSEGAPACAGQAMSPIDIDTTETRKGSLPALTFSYQSMPLQVLDDGHTIEVLGDGKNAISYNGVTYLLKQFHVHRGSEHTLNGKAAPMELHLVNQDERTGAIIVLGVFLTNGPQNAVLQQVLANLPTTQDQPNVVAGVSINPADLLPQNKAYYTYADSPMSASCTQQQDWFIFKNPVAISAGQEGAFAQKYPKNNRPIQALGNREVREN
ncbi:carbonic anhydrase [Fibrella aestuarina BUZ 2]|uniref:carbonic anhydrase n=1 Tax=Fibrella aestuarina BUZ 2 TaxID=1166018 RepID=I0K7K0_9BACT|nr:carbonic anhydrase family protein [Fibrella aestuarina]CCH00103.1 carbonic anhydrase [Fibrella aestuarina BUZ 2]